MDKEEEKKEEKVYSGKVLWFKFNYGFASWEKDGKSQKDIFIHYSDIANQEGYRTLRKGQKISFELGVNNNGDPKAVNVLILEQAAESPQVNDQEGL